ncbi:PQQ-binding-like beta-propeller repeat protein [Ferruginibacter sp.]|uniref:outer membrane protein assembly factor BamB family protein n=1 Tax=Ferruginibacter sp. TaxID=1940288 RepID=UPI0019A21437|nr:PQQ-binding-like beta-propeller repeat protein [Ferruginibacter sp.]MBC7627482.1 PQQ-binding-like beta-propeller repeat protein [Ferruginibacter sp.]
MKIIKALFTCCMVIITMVGCNSKKNNAGWPQYKGSDANMHYSSLTQVDTNNVTQLKLAWQYHSGGVDTSNHSQIQCNPIMVDGLLYGTAPNMQLFAIDAATGKEKWKFNPFDSLPGSKKTFFILNNCRGTTYWTDGKEDKRILYTAGSNLYCVNALDGKLVRDFGTDGKIDLHDGLDRDVKDLFITSTTPGIIYKDLIIMGSRVDEGAAAAPGHIRAYNVKTGKRQWIFHTIPQPGEAGYESWDDSTAYKFIGGANAWSGFSMDQKRGIVYTSTGSASFDFFGGRRTGNDLFANCILALDAATGKLIWYFQTVHHDVWDRDLSSPPILVTITREGKKIDALAVTTKSGFIFLFDRTNGKALNEIIEQPVPGQSDLVSEQLSPTQPIPTAPVSFMRQLFTEKDINPLLPDSSYKDVKKRWASYKNDNLFNPPSLQGTIVFPGLDGGAEWGGPTFDPASGLLYINANEMAWIIQAVDIKSIPVKRENYAEAGARLYQANCMGCHGPERKGSGNFPTLIDIEKKYSAASFDTLIQSGRRMMPAFKQLDLAERNAVATFVLNQSAQKNKRFIDTAAKKDDPFKLPYTITGYNKFLSKEGYPAIAPPWGTLNAIDLSTGQYVWKKPFGTDPAFANTKEPTGAESYGASVVTAGGLLFIAAAKDGKLRAYNKRDGNLLWQVNLPAPGFATPAVYEMNGKQYIVIACGGGKMSTKSGDSYVAYALP